MSRPESTPRRDYRSRLRTEQARKTRLRIRRAARELLGSQGFAATTVTGIATSAGVSPATVYAIFESKAGIVSAMLDDLEEGIDLGSRLEAVFDEADPHRQLRAYVALHCDLFDNGTDVLRATQQARHTSEVSALVERGDANRRGVIDELARRWHRGDGLPAGLRPEAAADRMWLLTTVDGYLSAIDQLGWSPEQYRQWLGDLLDLAILRRDEDS